MFLGISALTPQFGNCVQERPFCKTRKAICLRLHMFPFLESNQEHHFQVLIILSLSLNGICVNSLYWCFFCQTVNNFLLVDAIYPYVLVV